MERLIRLSQDKQTLADLREFFNNTLYSEIIDKTIKKEDVSGYSEAYKIIKKSLNLIDDLYKPDKPKQDPNQAE